MKKFTVLMTAIMMSMSALVMPMNVFAEYTSEEYEFEEYADVMKDYSYQKFTFDELLSMTDEEFIKLDTYHGNTPAENQGTFTMYRCIYSIMNGSGELLSNKYYDGGFPYTSENRWDIGTEKTYYVYNGSSDEELDTLYETVNGLGTIGNMFDKYSNPICAIVKLDNHSGEYADGGWYLGVSTLRSSFYLPNCTDEKVHFNIDEFKNDMQEVFGDSIEYEVLKELSGDGELNGIMVKFNVDECYDFNQENLLYFSKLYYALTSINPYFSYSREYNISTLSEPAFTNETTGDANLDGVINIADVVAVSAFAGNPEKNSLTEQGIINADVHNTGDGITTNDALVIQQYLANIITEF